MYGLPPVPNEPRHRERYRSLLKKIKRKSRLVEATFRINPSGLTRPAIGGIFGGPATLASIYGEVFFSQCDAVTNSFNLIAGGTGSNVNLTSDGTANGTVVSEGNLITDTIVQCLYLGPLP